MISSFAKHILTTVWQEVRCVGSSTSLVFGLVSDMTCLRLQSIESAHLLADTFPHPAFHQ